MLFDEIDWEEAYDREWDWELDEVSDDEWTCDCDQCLGITDRRVIIAGCDPENFCEDCGRSHELCDCEDKNEIN